MRTVQILILFISFLTFNTGTSQGNMAMLKDANRKFAENEFVDAREIYKKVAHKGYKSPDVLQKLGDSYYFDDELENAMEWYAELITKYSEYPDYYLFRYSQCLKKMELYKESNAMMIKYYYKKGIDPSLVFKKSKTEYLDAINLQTGRFKLIPFNYNSEGEDFAPHYGPSEKLIFSSTRKKDTTDRTNSGIDFYELENTKVKKLGGLINSKFQEASAVYSKGKDTIYFTRGKKGKSKNNRHYKPSSPKIYRAVLKNGKWKSADKLSIKGDNYTIMHPSLSPNGKSLYFASDMTNKNGTLDLYVVQIKSNGQLGMPKNLGDKINTLGDETFPFVSKNGDLYFASNGHFGLGGLDLFVSELKDGQYQEPYNLGKPINSIDDDTSLIFDENLKEGYFASNRKEDTNDLDIYRFKQLKDYSKECSRVVKGKLVNARSLEGIPNLEIQVLNDDNEQIDEVITNESGDYSLSLFCSNVYSLKIQNSQYKNTEKVLYIDKHSDEEINITTKLEEGFTLVKKLLTNGEDLNDVLELSKIYFDSNTANIRLDSHIELQKIIELLKTNVNIELEIKSYTDNTGDSTYNKKLSQQRAENTKRYIVENGNVDNNRITALGLGESNPIVNCLENCSETDLQTNRRSEFIIKK